MTLDEYLSLHNLRPKDFAESICKPPISFTTLYGILNGRDTLNSTAHIIQEATNGQVTTKELLPPKVKQPRAKRRSFRPSSDSLSGTQKKDNSDENKKI